MRPPNRVRIGPPWWSTALLAPMLVLTGCFVYAPVGGASPSPGEDVRLVIHPEAARRLAAEAGRSVQRLDGRLVSMTGDSVAVSVWVGPGYRGTAFERMRRTYALAEPDVLEIQTRQLSRGRTALTALAVGAGLAFVIERVVNSRGGASGQRPDPGPPAPVIISR